MLDLISAIKPTLDPEKWFKVIKYFLPSERARRWLDKNGIKQDDPTFFLYLDVGNKDVVEHFLKTGKHIDTVDGNKNTPLIIAAWKGHEAIVDILLKSKRKPTLDGSGAYKNTALMAAIQKERTGIANQLRSAGASEAGVPRAELLAAAERGDAATVDKLIRENVDVNARDLEGNTPLILAAERGHKEVVLKLCERPEVDIYAKRKDGKTAGEVAGLQGHLDIADRLLLKGAREKLERMDIKYDDEPFFRYLKVGDKTVVELFLKAGKWVNTVNSRDDSTPLIIAAWEGHKEIVEILIESQRKAMQEAREVNGDTRLMLDAKEVNGNTALMAAILKGHSDIAVALRGAGASEKGVELAELIVAAERGDLATIEKLIGEGASVNASDLEGNTPLILAAERGQRQIVTALIRSGALLDHRNNKKMSAAEVAHLQRHADIEKMLRAGGAEDRSPIADLIDAIESGDRREIEDKVRPENLNATNMEGVTPLILAVQKDDLDTLRLLIARGAPVDVRDALGRTALLVATTRQRADFVSELIDAGADPEATDLNGQSPISAAISSGNREIRNHLLRSGKTKAEKEARLVEAVKNGDLKNFRLLLLEEVNPNARVEHGQTPLITACKFGQIEFAREIIKAGADLEQPDSDGITPIMTAILYRRGEMEEMLQEAGAEDGADEARLMVAAETNDRDAIRKLIEKAKVNTGGSKGRTALTIASEQGHIEAVQELIRGHADVNTRDKKRQTALMIASQLGRTEVVRELIASNADLSARDKDQQTALMLAAREGQLEVVEALLDKLIASEQKTEMDAAEKGGRTALMLAASKGHTTVIHAFIARLPRLDAQDAQLRTALIHAAMQGHTDVVQALIMAGANIYLRDNDQKTAYMWAFDKGFQEIVRLLWKAREKVTDDDRKLSLAITQGRLEVFQGLLDLGKANANGFDGRGRTMLIAAIESNRLDMASQLLKTYGADPGLRDKQKRTPLMVTCDRRHPEIVTTLLDALRTKYPIVAEFQAKVDEKDKNGKTALLFACERKLTEAAGELIADGANTNVVDKDEQTPLKVAILKGDTATKDLLKRNGATAGEQDAYLLLAAANDDLQPVLDAIDSGADVNARGEKGRTPLILASDGGQLAVVRELIARGAQVNIPGKANETALLMAARRGHAEVVRYLIEQNAEVNAKKDRRAKPGRTPLLEAARRGFTKVVEELIRGRASVDDKTADGKTALILAASHRRTDVAMALIAAKANVNESDNNGFNALIWAASNGDGVLTDTLIKQDANVNWRSNTDATPLMAAILEGQTEIVNKLKAAGATAGELEAQLIVAVRTREADEVQRLIDREVSVNAKTLDGNTPLTLATGSGDFKITENLLSAGAAVDMKGYANKTALMLASEKGHARIAELCISHKAKVDSRSDDGSTALMYAARAGDEEIVQLLIANEADANALDTYGNTALDLARQMIHSRTNDSGAPDAAVQKRFDNIIRILEEAQKDGVKTLYVTHTGDCYHRSGCVYLKDKTWMVLEEAPEDTHYRPCSRCNLPQQ